MDIIKELPEIFEEFAEQKKQSFLEVKKCKDRHIPVIGAYCSYFPRELATAMGAVPVGLCSSSEETVKTAESVLPKNICPLIKSSYGFAISDRCPYFHFSDLVVGETTCDGKKKMYEMMAKFKPVHVMELPNSQSERGYEFWRGEVIRAKEFLEEFFHVVITEEMTRSAVHLNNRIRMSLKSLCEVMKLDPVPVLGEDIQKMVLGSKYRFDFQTTPELVAGVREKILKEYGQGKRQERRVRILVTGCPVGGDSLKVIRAVEENGGVVVATENCSGVRALSRMVEEGRWKELIREIPIKKGDFIQIEPGTVHAIKAHTLILETQQNSDITYRLYDYDRVQANGKKRELHIQKSLDVITVDGEEQPNVESTCGLPENVLNQIYSCEKYDIFKLTVNKEAVIDQKYPFLAASVLEGEGQIDGSPLGKGDHFIVPAGYGELRISGNMSLILSTVEE